MTQFYFIIFIKALLMEINFYKQKYIFQILKIFLFLSPNKKGGSFIYKIFFVLYTGKKKYIYKMIRLLMNSLNIIKSTLT